MKREIGYFSLLLMLFLFAWSMHTTALGHEDNQIQKTLTYDSLDRTVIDVTVHDFIQNTVMVRGREYATISLEGAAYVQMGEAGQPQLPRISESLIIPDTARMEVKIIDAEYYEIPGMMIAPSKGTIRRSVDPASVPYRFGPIYSQNRFYPGDMAAARTPFVLHDVRGLVVDIHPFQYNPVTKVLRVYRQMKIEVFAAGISKTNIIDRTRGMESRPDRSFEMIYANQFSNYAYSRTEPPREEGDMLIICHGAFMTAMQPFVDWKNYIGIYTTIVDVATIGNDPASIKSHIQSVYNSSNLAFVLLVGDYQEVMTDTFAFGDSDPSYSIMDGDNYPDVFVGRFSAENTDQVETQVQRTIEYEQMDHDVGLGGWHAYGMGISSNQGAGTGHYGESDIQHVNLMRAELMEYGFTKVDQIYDYSATKAMIIDGINEGRRVVNYTGHGWSYGWDTTDFDTDDINDLENVGMLPIVDSVACRGGDFSYRTCFGEAWLRATHNGEPAGAVAAHCCSVGQFWAEPMYSQGNHARGGRYGATDRFWSERNWSVGGCWFGGGCCMMDLAGSPGQEMFMTWNVFGDPSLRLIGKAGPPTLSTSSWKIPVDTPVDITFTISLGAEYAGYNYVLLSGVSGTAPGKVLPGGLEVPLNFDFWTYFCLFNMNTIPLLQDFHGALDPSGEAQPVLSSYGFTPIDPRYVGYDVFFTAVAWPIGRPFEVVTNVKTLTFTE